MGHVRSDGMVYSHPNSEVGHDVGRIEMDCSIYQVGGAALLLLLNGASAQSETPKAEEPPRYEASSDSRKSPKFWGIGGTGRFSSGGGDGGVIEEMAVFFVIILAIAFVKMLIPAVPMIILGGCSGLAYQARRDSSQYFTEYGWPASQLVASAKRRSRFWAALACIPILIIDFLIAGQVPYVLAMYFVVLVANFWLISYILQKRMLMSL